MKMKNENPACQVLLASESPRRRELLHLLFEKFEVCSPNVDETLAKTISPQNAVQELALRKARAAAASHPNGWLVIGADTLVALDGKILGKPKDEADAAAMLRMLSGQMHTVFTGVALCLDGHERVFYSQTQVHFAQMCEEQIAWYISTKEPMDKAGAYGIQHYGARFIKGIEGDYFTVMGLPVHRLYEEVGLFTK